MASLALVGLPAALPEEARWGGVRIRLRRFALFSALLPTLGLAAFVILSGIAGIIRLAQPQAFDLPDDFIGAGPLGWVGLAAFVLGILSPAPAGLLAARRISRNSQDASSPSS